MQDGCGISLTRRRFWANAVSLQVGIQRYGEERRKKKTKDGRGDRLRTDRQRHTQTKMEMSIPGP